MGLLTPALLAATIAIAVPVWLHLTRRPPKERQPFPSLMFLGESPLNATRRRSIRNPLLLALRVLAIVLLVAAFSRPFLAPGEGGAGAEGGVREIALLFDRSYSMAAGDRLDAGKAAAREVFAELREGDRLTLVAFDDAAQVLGPATRDVDALRAALDSVRPGEGGTSYAGALRLAESVLSASPGPRREVVMVSDFAAGRTLADPEVPLPPGTRVRLLPATTDPLDDLATEDVSLRRSGFAAGERIRVVARIANAGAHPVTDRAVSLTLDGAQVAVESVSLEPGASATVEFPPFSVASGAAAGQVRVGPDDLAVNDARFFVAEPRRAITVMIVEPDGSGPRRGLHLRRALELGRSPTFTLRRRTERSLRGEDLAGMDLLILDGVPFPAGETGARLRAFVEAGGGLIAAAGARSGGRIPELADGLLPSGSARSVSRAEGSSLGRVEYGHPIFSAFRDPGSGDLGAPRVDRYRRLSEEGMRVLARFDDGAPALLEADLGLGRSLVWATTLGDAWTDLPLQPVYLPFVHRLLLHAAGW
ncbi:MAG: VWA domain-containing protein, partial [Myxococcota bacterium]